MTARQAAAGALKRLRMDGVWPDKWLSEACAGMDKRDESLSYALTFSVIQNYRLIDWYIGSVSSISLKKIEPAVLDIIRLGTAQLAFFDRIPKSAAVNESVKMVAGLSGKKAVGFCNAVLRKLTTLPAMPEDPAVRYSCQDWFYELMSGVLGKEKCIVMLEANNKPVKYTARVNTLKTDDETLCAALEQKGFGCSMLPDPEHAVELDSINGIFDTQEHKDGWFYVQDAAAQSAVYALDPRPGELVIDLCAAPGGKSLLAAQLMQNRGRIISVDPSDGKLDLIKQNSERCGVTIIETLKADGRKMPPELYGAADRVICDVPCSGTGVIRKKPEIRLKTRDEAAGLSSLQYELLREGFELLKKGGVLIYSTCSVLPFENEQIVERFAESCENAKFGTITVSGKDVGPMRTSYPGIDGTDGFYIAKLIKL